MSARRLGVALLVLLAGAPLLLAALRRVREAEAWELVAAAARAHEQVDYAGVVAWENPGCRTWTLEVEHDSATGWTRYAAGRHAWKTEGPSARTPDPAAFCLDLQALRESYTPELRSATRVCGRPAQVVELEPRFPGRPRLKLVCDLRTHLPLRVEVRRHDGSAYRVAAFREIEFTPRSVTAPAGSYASRWGAHSRGVPIAPGGLEQAAGFAVWMPDYLPPGFRLARSRVRDWAVPEIVLLFTDGATAFEIRQHPLLTPACLEAALARRVGAARARAWVRRLLERRMADLAAGGGGGQVIVRRRKRHAHTLYELRVGKREFEITSRNDLDPAEIERVLRSLRAR